MKVQISLTDFVDFVIKVGPPKLTKVREIKNRGEYQPAFDFWRQLREGLAEFHRGNHPMEYLDQIHQRQTDPRRERKYLEAVLSYKEFLGHKKFEWFDPPRKRWVVEDLGININPELGLIINGKPHVIKIFFKDDRLDKRKVEVVFHLMENQLKDDSPSGSIMGVLDIKNGRLITPTKPPENISILLMAEANTFMRIWDAL